MEKIIMEPFNEITIQNIREALPGIAQPNVSN